MSKLIRCECGFMARGDTDDTVVAAIVEHMRTDHRTCWLRSNAQIFMAGSSRSSRAMWIEQIEERL
jgi:hypothetical protein